MKQKKNTTLISIVGISLSQQSVKGQTQFLGGVIPSNFRGTAEQFLGKRAKTGDNGQA